MSGKDVGWYTASSVYIDSEISDGDRVILWYINGQAAGFGALTGNDDLSFAVVIAIIGLRSDFWLIILESHRLLVRKSRDYYEQRISHGGHILALH
jgi:hypothetical protein